METSSLATILMMGTFFGLTAGISPGPLLTLVITETLSKNRGSGIRVAIAPLITDLPIILATYFVFSRLNHFDAALSLLSVSGGLFFAWLGYETLRAPKINDQDRLSHKGSLKKGIIANLLNPQPYIFWITIGIPTAFTAYKSGIIAVILYFLSFYVMLVGSKVAIALLVERSKGFLGGKGYKSILIFLGLTLLFFAILFIYKGLKTSGLFLKMNFLT